MAGIEHKALRWAELRSSRLLLLLCVLPLAGARQSSLRSRSIGLAQALQAPNASGASGASAASGASGSSSAASAGGNTSAGSGNSSGLVDGQVSTLYWAEVDRALEAAALVTPSPESTTPTPDPYSAILGVSKGGQPENAENVGANNYELVTPPPPFPVVKKTPKVSVLPYGMALGAEVLYGMSEKVPTQPLPPQEEVDASFQAQCPNVTFASEVFITPPCNGGGLGSWSESPGLRNLLRWSLNSKGGIDFGIDHALWGKGSISFASLKEKMTLNTVVFELFNCMNVMRYSIEETIVKVNHMAPGAQSTAVDHDVGETATAVFYQYLIKHANGTLVAETSQYRLPETEINFTSFVPGTLRSQTFALAKRNKRWAGTDWRTCEHSQGWNISFPLGAAGNATAQDLQVAAAAVLTLLAWREEHVSSDGFEHEGQFYLYWSLMQTVLWILLALVVLVILALVFQRFAILPRLRRFFFRLEEVLLPKRPHQVRQPVLKPAW